MVLNRRISLFDPIGAALVTIDPREIVRDKVLRRQALIRIEPPLSIDNMEALSITESNGRTILWLASDDNFSLFQRTLLLKFELKQSAEAIPSERDS